MSRPAQPSSRRSIPSTLLAAAAFVLTTAAAAHPPAGEQPRMPVTVGAKHPSAPDATRFVTSRDAPALPLPAERDAFFFVVFGDRTGGPAEGVEVLARAVHDVNLLEPDLVMTVGDLIEGYNQRPQWIAQMREFKGIMDGLLCPWFPVAGNHDVYWRGPGRPEGEHESSYEMHFGPLWYAFEHKGCWFIVLYSDEGNPETGQKTFNDPAAQVMSDEQRSWLAQTLDHAADARHVFVFLHHPRWLGGNYGEDWQRVHAMLAAAGNVRAVFAGHIHRMRYDGMRDGIEYVTLATTGGHQGGQVPEAGYLHHFHVVTVRDDQIAMSALPVGDVLDVRRITGDVSDETRTLAAARPSVGRVTLREDGSIDRDVEVTFRNPVQRPVEITLSFDSDDPRWSATPDHVHEIIEPGESRRMRFRLGRPAGTIDAFYAAPRLVRDADYLATRARFRIPRDEIELPVAARLPAPEPPYGESVLVLDGDGDGLRVPPDLLDVPDGPLTLECWFRGVSFEGRRGLITKTEVSEYGLFVSEGVPAFFIHVGGAYAEASAESSLLAPDRWHHLAGVYDGREARLYLDGALVASTPGRGERRRNELPLYVGGDTDPRGRLVSSFEGRIDGVRLSTVARYHGSRVTPARRVEPDDQTMLLLHMDGGLGPWVYDASGRETHPVRVGDARLMETDARR